MSLPSPVDQAAADGRTARTDRPDDVEVRQAVGGSVALATATPPPDDPATDPNGATGHLAPGTGPTPIVHAPVSHNGRPEPGPGPSPGGERQGGSCTTAQLRRFIKSRAYIPLHEIRRRFLISTEDDDVAGIQLATGRIYVGLPEREAQMLGELLRGGEVGYELQLDPVSPIVVGVYPMRPVTRS